MNQEKNYNVKDLYVGYIALQSGVTIPFREEPFIFGEKPDYTWTCKQTQFGFFVKTIKGFKHVLTNKYYPVASYRTGHKLVITDIKKFTQFEKRFCDSLISSGSKLDKERIELLEERYNFFLFNSKNDEKII